jgi:Cytidylate kinase-like family
VPRSVVCISRAWGAGGEDVGRLVGERLGFVYVDEQIISRAAERAGVDPATVADQERRKPLFAGLLDYLGESGAAFAPVPALPRWDEPSSDAVRAFIREAIHEVAERGKAVIVAHAASHAVGAGPGALRVLITASPETRARRVAEADAVGESEAAKTVRSSDAARADYLKRFYGVGDELPTQYDLVINTDTLSAEQAADLIVQAASSGQGS